MSSVTIVCISDTHELHRELDLPAGDLLLHAGDFTMFSRSLKAVEDFNSWLGEHSHSSAILTPGNHEFFIEADPSRRNLLTNASVLINEAVEVMGLKIWGSPITPPYGGAFGRSSANDRIALYRTIPPDIDILMTHGPPYGILDCPPGTDNHTGCRELLEAVLKLKPRLHLFGHVHGAYGMANTGSTLFVNAAVLREDGSPGNASGHTTNAMQPRTSTAQPEEVGRSDWLCHWTCDLGSIYMPHLTAAKTLLFNCPVDPSRAVFFVKGTQLFEG